MTYNVFGGTLNLAQLNSTHSDFYVICLPKMSAFTVHCAKVSSVLGDICDICVIYLIKVNTIISGALQY